MERQSLLVSDLDNTLLGDDDALLEFAELFERCRGGLLLAYASGRSCESIRRSIRETALPQANAIVGGVGTEIEFRGHVGRVKAWPRLSGRWDAAEIRESLREENWLQPQPDDLQSEFKISYYGHDLTADCLGRLQQRLARHGFRVNIVYSSSRDLDILPANANKGTAAAYLARCWNIRGDRVVVAGDSGNDLAMFRSCFRGVVVANAREELKRLSGDHVFHSTEAYAAGVLDGLRYWNALDLNRVYS